MPGLVPNARSHRIEASATLAIAAEASRLKSEGHDVVSLSAGEPDFPTPQPIAQAGIDAIERGDYRYTAAAGTPALRAAGARWLGEAFGLDYAADEVLVSSGAKGALHMALDTIVEPGDRVLVMAPHWVSYPALITMADGEPVVVPMAPERGFVPDAATIDRIAEESGARGILANFPTNPSGAVPDRRAVEELVAVCARRDMWIVSDEIYATLLYDDAEHISPAAVKGGRERTIVVNGFTKSHTLTGWRTSFLAGPKDVVSAAARIQSQVLGNACTISQAAMLAACEQPLPDEHKKRMAAFTERRNFLVERINAIPGAKLLAPRGSFYALIDLRELCEQRGIDDLHACQQLLEQQHLALVPGSAFAAPGFVRASFAAAMSTLEQAVERLQRWAAGN
ncbi:MAG: pyridoxal phosphate-dependent aminotransferase [Planctomycetota bacterium]